MVFFHVIVICTVNTEDYFLLATNRMTALSDIMFPWLQLLEEGDRVTISGNRVEVGELNRADGGVYTCTFKNIVGQVSHIIKLVIEGNILIPDVMSALISPSFIFLLLYVLLFAVFRLIFYY